MTRVRFGLLLVGAWIGLHALASAQTAVPPSAGDGLTTDTAYQIVELGNLVWLHDQAAASTTATSGKYYKLMNDIDASATATWNDDGTTTLALEGFNPIGGISPYIFKGIFLGQSYKITGLVINRDTDYNGLFGWIVSGVRVQDLGLEGGSVRGGSYTGALVGRNGTEFGDAGKIANCYATLSVTGTSYVGGLIGAGGVTNSYATGTVTGTDRDVGGLIGSGGAISSWATGAVTGKGAVGGLIGSGGTVSDSYATGAVTGTSCAGGLVGACGVCSRISNSYATGAVTGTSSVGGLVGFHGYEDCTISKSYATGAVTGSSVYVGGLVGNNSAGAISDSYAVGAVAGISYVGGLVGYNQTWSTISKCYATGAVTGTSIAGGLVGGNFGTVTASYWNRQTSGQSSSDGGTGLTTVQMKRQASFSGWSFPSTWAIGGAYPYLADLTTCTLTYQAGANGRINDGPTSGTTLAQVINLGSTGTPVTAWADTGYFLTQWSDGSTANPRTDSGQTSHTTLTAEFSDHCDLTYLAGAHGTVDGLTSVTQVITLDSSAAPVTAIADEGWYFLKWSDDSRANPRLDANRKRNLTVTALFTAIPREAPDGGNGLTSATSYLIRTLPNLVWLSDQAAAGLTGGKYYNLMNDIDASATATWNDEDTTTLTLEGFSPIGNNSSFPFRGYFRGRGCKITGLTINRSSANNVGLFGYVGSGAKLQDLGLEGGSVTGSSCAGGLVGYNDSGAVSNCYATCPVTGTSFAGGLMGYNTGGTITNCYATGAVTGGSPAGGLVGSNYPGTIANCYATGAVTGGSTDVGGLAGQNFYGTISNCRAVGAVTGSYQSVGGLVGYNYGSTIINSYATASVTGHSDVGGLVGLSYSNNTISRCYATGAVMATGGTVGGLVGCNYSTISNCFAAGSVTVTQTHIGNGGLVGSNWSPGAISNSYAMGLVPRSGGNYGGLVGFSNAGTAQGAYWNTETSGLAISAGGTGLTALQMKSEDNFISGSTTWDFTSTWAISGGYPYLHGLATCVMTYKAGLNGRISDGLTSGTTLAQVLNLGSTSAPVTAIANEGFYFVEWSDGSRDNPRYDRDVANDTTFTALFHAIDNEPPEAGDGLTTATAYQIKTLPNLGWLSAQAADGLTSGRYYVLMNNIDASDTVMWNDPGTTIGTLEGLNPIGNSSSHPFGGVFLGQGYKITGLTINRSGTNYVGLFGYVGSGARMRNLGLEGVSVRGGAYVGGLAGYNSSGAISNCHVTGAVTGSGDYAGGLVGHNSSGAISSCYAACPVRGAAKVGGLVGESVSGPIMNCHATGAVTGNGGYYVGGLAGCGGGAISNCYATGAVTGEQGYYVGGLVGYCSDTISSCSATGAVTGTGGYYLGGLVGYCSDAISNCYATGVVTGDDGYYGDEHYYVGGLAGYSSGAISNCHATGAVTGDSRYVGGLVGDSSSSPISYCYATGAVTGASNYVGGLVGNHDSGAISYCSATGTVSGHSDFVGGLVGNNGFAPISYCYATGTVSGHSDFVGGLVGNNGDGGAISYCHATGAVYGYGRYVGGLVGNHSSGAISYCHATGAVAGNFDYTGGLIGYNGSGISKCYATGAVTGRGSYIGGLAGANHGSITDCYAVGPVVAGFYRYTGALVGYTSNAATISRCYATGTVTGTSDDIGGLVGARNVGVVTASYWNTETSGRSSSSGGTGLTTVQMKQQASFSGWDFTSTWAISGGYPYLVGLTNCRLTYKAGENGQIGDGLTTVTATGSPLAQVINLAAASTPVKAMARTGYRFDQWSDGSTANPRRDSGLTSDTTLTAEFALPAAAADWRLYR